MEALRVILVKYDEKKTTIEKIEEELVKSIMSYNMNKDLDITIEIGPYSKFT